MPLVTYNEQEYHLSHEEEEKLNEFQAVTNFPQDDLPLVINLLQNYGWQLERALGFYFDGNWKDSLVSTEAPSIPDRPPTPGPARPLSDRDVSFTLPFVASETQLVPSLRVVKPLPSNYREVFSVVGLNKSNGNVWHMTPQDSPLFIILMFIPRILMKLGLGIVSLLWGLITFGFHSHVDEGTKVCRVPTSPKEKDLPIDQVLPQIIDEEPLTRLKKLISGLSFNEALKICQDEFKYLLLVFVGDVLSDDPDVNSQRFLSKILANPAVLSLLENYKDEIVLFIGSVNELETWLVSEELRIKYTPECLLVGNVLNSNGSLNGVTKLSVLSKLRISTAKRFQNSLKVTIEKFNPELVVSRTEKEELRLAREIKKLQDDAYQASLERDRIKEEERKLKEEEERMRRDIELKREQNKKMKETLKHLSWLRSCVDTMNNKQDQAPDNGESNSLSATLQIRTSEGSRLVKKFTSNTTLHALYVNVGCHLYLQNNSNTPEEWAKSIVEKICELAQDESVLLFKDNELLIKEMDVKSLTEAIEQEMSKWGDGISAAPELEFDFELVSPFPRKRLPVDKALTVKEVSQLWPNGSLLVEDIIEEDDDEAEEKGEESDK